MALLGRAGGLSLRGGSLPRHTLVGILLVGSLPGLLFVLPNLFLISAVGVSYILACLPCFGVWFFFLGLCLATCARPGIFMLYGEGGVFLCF